MGDGRDETEKTKQAESGVAGASLGAGGVGEERAGVLLKEEVLVF